MLVTLAELLNPFGLSYENSHHEAQELVLNSKASIYLDRHLHGDENDDPLCDISRLWLARSTYFIKNRHNSEMKFSPVD